MPNWRRFCLSVPFLWRLCAQDLAVAMSNGVRDFVIGSARRRRERRSSLLLTPWRDSGMHGAGTMQISVIHVPKLWSLPRLRRDSCTVISDRIHGVGTSLLYRTISFERVRVIGTFEHIAPALAVILCVHSTVTSCPHHDIRQYWRQLRHHRFREPAIFLSCCWKNFATGRWLTSSLWRIWCVCAQPIPSGTDRCWDDDPAQTWNPEDTRTNCWHYRVGEPAIFQYWCRGFCATVCLFTCSFRRVWCVSVQLNPAGTDRCWRNDPEHMCKSSCARTCVRPGISSGSIGYRFISSIGRCCSTRVQRSSSATCYFQEIREVQVAVSQKTLNTSSKSTSSSMLAAKHAAIALATTDDVPIFPSRWSVTWTSERICTIFFVNTTPQMTCFRGAQRMHKWRRKVVMMNTTAWQQVENLHTKWRIQKSGKSRIIYEYMTKNNMNANDNIHACVTLHNTDVNDNIYDCVALHDAYTTDHFHWHPNEHSAHSLS